PFQPMSMSALVPVAVKAKIVGHGGGEHAAFDGSRSHVCAALQMSALYWSVPCWVPAFEHSPGAAAAARQPFATSVSFWRALSVQPPGALSTVPVVFAAFE